VNNGTVALFALTVETGVDSVPEAALKAVTAVNKLTKEATPAVANAPTHDSADDGTNAETVSPAIITCANVFAIRSKL
jgi:hypothetical protein